MGRPQKRTRAELIQKLAEHRQALAVSCAGYDSGLEWEAGRLATAVFTIVHDGGKIVSLLTQLGLRGHLRFVSSGRFVKEPGLVAASPPLVMFESTAEKGSRFIPRLDRRTHSSGAQLLQFRTWWETEVIYKDHHPSSFDLTRRRLVFALRHQDGGSHVGDLTDPGYIRFLAGGGWFGGRGDGGPQPLITGVTASMRQVAWEVTETLKQLGDVA